MSFKAILSGVAAAALAIAVVGAQAPAPSPDGSAQVQFGKAGKWMEITYSRPILRGRTNIFGAGANYGKDVNSGAPVWRAGANVTTRLRTEVPIVIGGKTIAAGTYDVFIDLKENNWTFILSTWPIQKTYDPNNKTELWGSFSYTADKDVVRAPMTLSKNPISVDQLTWAFGNITATGGDIVIMWEHQIASVPFKLG